MHNKYFLTVSYVTAGLGLYYHIFLTLYLTKIYIQSNALMKSNVRINVFNLMVLILLVYI